MDKTILLVQEQIIAQSVGDLITLTNYRIRYQDKVWGREHIISLLLEKISSVEVHYRSKPILAILAFLSILGGFFSASAMKSPENVVIGCFIGIVLFIIYLYSRKHYLIVSSDGGGEILFHIKGMNNDKVLQFLNNIEQAIMNRREELK